MRNPAFRRGMDPEYFDLIRRKDGRDYIPLPKQLEIIAGKLKKKKKKPPPPPPPEVAKEVKKPSTTSTSTTTAKKKKKKKIPPLPSEAVAAKKSATATSKTSNTYKKRKKSASVQQPSKKAKISKKEAKTSKKRKEQASTTAPERPKKKTKRLSAEGKQAQDRVDEHSILQNLFGEWSLWSIPSSLKLYLRKKKVKNASRIGTSSTSTVLPESKHLLCEENMPDYLVQDEKQAFEDLEEMIINDRRQRQLRQEAWSQKFPIAKGKTLPPSKFNRPTNKWQKVTVGDKIDVYWRDDDQYYTATVIKHQEGTTYFHLFYEDDGATEWLDLSREDFKFYENQERAPVVASPGSPSRPSIIPRASSVTVDETPRKDNRSSGRTEPVHTLENHAHLAPFLRYSWGTLELGTSNKVGTAAYNKYVKERDSSAPSVSPMEILQDVRSLREEGVPATSEVDLLLQNDESSGLDHRILSTLRDLQHDISRDDERFEESLKNVRRAADYWQVSSLVQNIQRVESSIARSDEREARCIEKYQRKGFL